MRPRKQQVLLTATHDKTLSLWAPGRGPDQAFPALGLCSPTGTAGAVTHSPPGLGAGEEVRQLESEGAQTPSGQTEGA